MNNCNKYFKKYILAAAAALLLVCGAFSACGNGAEAQPSSVAAPQGGKSPASENTAPSLGGAIEERPMIEITMQDGGVIKLELDRAAAPITVDNFIKLAADGFYDGTTFHRVMENFMIQGGDPDGNGTGGPGYGIQGEFASNGWDNPISHLRGTISMARGSDPNSAGSQFFITNTDYTHLDGDYAAFGRVVDGMDVVDAISAVEKTADARGEVSVPVQPVVIKSIRPVEE